MSPYSVQLGHNELTHWPLGDLAAVLKVQCKIDKLIIQMRIVAHALSVKLLSGECPRTSVMISQHWFRWWLSAVRHCHCLSQCDPFRCSHMVSTGHNELMYFSIPFHSFSDWKRQCAILEVDRRYCAREMMMPFFVIIKSCHNVVDFL